MRIHPTALLLVVFTEIGCGGSSHVVSAPPPAPPGLHIAADSPPSPVLASICLPEDARIATPKGNVRVTDMRPGMPVFTQDEKGQRIAVNVDRVGSTMVPASHMLVQIELSDGRTLRASPGHPTADGRLLGALKVGEQFDGATILQSKRVPYGMPRTFDILPAGKTGAYWANGVLVGSTLQSGK